MIKPLPLAALSKLPGDAGGTAVNVNRWRKQVGLAPSPEIGGECDTISPHRDTISLHCGQPYFHRGAPFSHRAIPQLDRDPGFFHVFKSSLDRDALFLHRAALFCLQNLSD